VAPVAPVHTAAADEVSSQRAATQAYHAVRKVMIRLLGRKKLHFLRRASHTPVIKVVDSETKK